MIILSIDSSTPVASVAVVQNAQLLGEYMLNAKNTHSQKLMGMIARLLDDLSLAVNDIDVFAVAKGPGSFTGLRIGMATAKGLAQGSGKRLIAVAGLDALAYNFPSQKGLICPILHAKKNEVYAGLYKMQGGNLTKLWPEQAIKPLALAEQLQSSSQESIWFLGDGVAVYRTLLIEALGERAQFAPLQHLLPRAASVGFVALERAEQGLYDDYFTIEPLYIRQSEAEVQWEAKQSQAMQS